METLLLVAAALLAGFIDSQVGGGGVITLPALLAAGLPPHLALGTNKLVATGASSTAAIQYARADAVDGDLSRWAMPLAGLASAVGSWAVLHVAAQDIRWLVVLVMAAMTVYVLARPRFGHTARPERRTPARIAVSVGLVAWVGFYDGFLGPGTGSFFLFGLVALLGLGFVQAAALGRVLNFATNASALIVFLLLGYVDFGTGLPMIGGSIVGGYLGSRATLRGGTKWVRVLFVVVAGALMGRLLWGLL